MELELRPIVVDEVGAFLRTDEYGFGHRQEHPEQIKGWTETELDRTVAAFEGDEIVGVGRNYSLELTLPGGADIPVAGVSWISVRPTHRRRGILRRIMAYLVEEGARRGECASILTASEGSIYGRFGFGVATEVLSIELRHDAVTFARPVTDGRVRMIELDEASKIAPELFERVRAERNGAVSRPPVWWVEQWASPEEAKKRFDVVYERDGRVEGYAVYAIDGTWINGFNDKTVKVEDLVATTPDAEAALWQFLCSIDLTNRTVHDHVTADIELPWRLTDSRQMRTNARGDWLWLRPVDVPSLLSTRRYAIEETFVLEVRDEMRPDGDAAGRFLLQGGPDAASCERTERAPDLALDVSTLGSLTLGTIEASMLARAGRVEAHTSDALARADRLFAADRAPHNFTWF
jgi:predicted acetyltransferase